jgi:hypothetical protein
MKKLMVTILILVLGLSGMSYAQFGQVSRQPQIEVFGGMAIPLAPQEFKDYYKLGFSFHGQYVIFPSPKFGVSFAVAYEGFTFDDAKFIEDLRRNDPFTDYTGVGVDGTANIFELGIGVRPYLTSPEATTQFFLFGMATYNILKEKDDITYNGQTVTSLKNDDNKFGLAGGPGMEMPLTDTMNLIVQGVYRYIFTEDEGTSFLGITAGLVF